MSKTFNTFADLADFIAAETDSHDRSSTYQHAFVEHDERAKLSPVDEAEQLDMPDPDQARAAVEMVMQTLFDVFRDTRMEPFARDLVWGFVNSFHVVAKRINDREDDAEKELRALVRHFDPSEIYAVQVEETELLCRTLQGCREAMECMRDHAGEVYRVETGRPYSPTRGSRVSKGVTGSMIEGRNYLGQKARERKELLAPEGPVVVFSGGQQWEDHELLWNGLDSIRARVPEMILATTAQQRGCDAIAQAWAAARGVTVILFRLDRSLGNKAAFVRNDRLLSLKPVEAVICDGSGIQMNLAQKLRQARVPLHVVKLEHQRKVTQPAAKRIRTAETTYSRDVIDHLLTHPATRDFV